MPELFLELFSEEIPARMQARAAEDLARLAGDALARLSPSDVRTFHGPRRIALSATVAGEVGASHSTERGPRANAPEQALAGFLRKHAASREQLRRDGDYWMLEKASPAVPATAVIADVLPALLRRFPWPKSMRWGDGSGFVWVRPLRRIVCLLDGAVVPFDLRDGTDDGHGLASADLTEGHRFLAPGAFVVASGADWAEKLRRHKVLVDADERRHVIATGLSALADERQLQVVDDPGLLDEVAGLVEWPVPLLGRIDETHMDLPPEVRQVSMRVNQRYFAFRHADGSAAPWFGFAANIEPADGGAVSIAGNERVLRARFADARHFWDLDRRARLESRVPLLDHVTFHARLGSQGERVRRLERLAEEIAPLVDAGAALARDAARLCKADLVTGMVGEFPELQGVMGRYYALHDGEDPAVANAIAEHYLPLGPTDATPSAPLGIVAALADKVDSLVAFFAVGEKPTGSRDPFASRRAAQGVIRIILERGLRLPLAVAFEYAYWRLGPPEANPTNELLDFIADRLKVHLREQGARHDLISAAFAQDGVVEDDLVRLMARVDALEGFLSSEDGANLLIAYRRASNIVAIEERRDHRRYNWDVDQTLLQQPEELALAKNLGLARDGAERSLHSEEFEAAMGHLATLRRPVDEFFDKVTVNTEEPRLRENRLRLLSAIRATMNRVADFSQIEG